MVKRLKTDKKAGLFPSFEFESRSVVDGARASFFLAVAVFFRRCLVKIP
jgi:hypothetical protein